MPVEVVAVCGQCPDERRGTGEHRRHNRVEPLEALCQCIGDARRIAGGGDKACGAETPAALDSGPGHRLEIVACRWRIELFGKVCEPSTNHLLEKLLSDKMERFQFCRQQSLNHVPGCFEEARARCYRRAPLFGYRRRTWSRFDEPDAQRRKRSV